ncbi:hypothetical protein L484_024134 [Morus notabilis]|uniref:Uncharacterized protein n=1 Tax=Morus notabilis TaxID=981085 RepID=W9SBC3_9ROSA|nr:hypothetical protein L484_024134 [Morus notabilis]
MSSTSSVYFFKSDALTCRSRYTLQGGGTIVSRFPPSIAAGAALPLAVTPPFSPLPSAGYVSDILLPTVRWGSGIFAKFPQQN